MEQNFLSISANALRSCVTNVGFNISFERIHVNRKKSTPRQIMMYQCALNLYKILNFEEVSFETVTVLNQLFCTSRQTNFQILRDNHSRIGMNCTANKFYCLNSKIGINCFNLKYVHFKKIAKIQFLKYGKT